MPGDGNTNYVVMFILSRLSSQIQLSISDLLIAMGKPIISYWHVLAYGNMTGHPFFAREPIGNLFFLHEVVFEIP